MRSHAKVSILLSVLLLLGSLSGCESKPGIADIGSVEKEGSIVGNDPLYVPPSQMSVSGNTLCRS